MEATEKVIAPAEAQIGCHEKAGGAGLDDKSANSGTLNLRGRGDPQPGDQIFFGSANLSSHGLEVDGICGKNTWNYLI